MIEYAVSTANSTPASGWQDERLFHGLTQSTTYYAFARAKESANYSVGATLNATFVTKAALVLNPNVPALHVDFETAITLDVTPGNGTGTPTIVADPADNQEKSLQMVSTNYNRGAVVPIHLPFALKNYQSFSFRFRLVSGSPTNPISVYVADAKAKFVNYGFGNPANHSNQNQQFANLLLGAVPADYAMGNEWVTYTIDIPDDAESFNTIENLQGDIFVAIGINHGSSLTILLDDLTFNIKSDYAPEPSLTPTSATYSKAAAADVVVHMNLYGTNTLTGITGGNPAITSQGYTNNSDGTVTIYSSYLTTQADGPITLVFTSSNGKTANFVITIRSGTSLLVYDFAGMSTDPGKVWEFPATGSAGDTATKWTSGQGLVVSSTVKNDLVILPFTLPAGDNLTQYSLYAQVAGVSGDIGWKPLRAVISTTGNFSIGHTNTQIADFNNLVNQTNPNAATITNLTNVTNTMTGEIKIGFYLYEANASSGSPLVYRILKLELIKK
jgi:hypothetical protein